MTHDRDKNKLNNDEQKNLPPDPETLHTTDPQEKMEGPVSTTMHKIAHGFETNESKEEAEKKRKENM